jgi:hypothetical protein
MAETVIAFKSLSPFPRFLSLTRSWPGAPGDQRPARTTLRLRPEALAKGRVGRSPAGDPPAYTPVFFVSRLKETKRRQDNETIDHIHPRNALV